MSNKEFWKKIETVQGQRDSTWMRAGRYVLYIDSFKGRDLRSGNKDGVFEMVVLEVLDDSAAASEPEGPHRPGDRVSWAFQFSQEAALASLKTALANITGCPTEEITMDVCAELAANDQPLHGIVIEVDGRIILTKKNQTRFNKALVKRVIAPAELDHLKPLLASLKLTLAPSAS